MLDGPTVSTIVGLANELTRLPRMDTPPGRLRGKPSWLIGKNAAVAHRLLVETLAGMDARGYHYALLAAPDEFGPNSQAALSYACGIDRSDTVAMLNELVEQGLVVREPDPDARRRNIISITPAGRRRLEQLDV